MIQDYKFGSITINGKTYNFDTEVRWTGEVLRWQREESHLIDVQGVSRAVRENPKFIVIGTGAYGVAKVTTEAQELMAKKDIKLIMDKTEEAVKIFNTLLGKSQTIGLFHLTC